MGPGSRGSHVLLLELLEVEHGVGDARGGLQAPGLAQAVEAQPVHGHLPGLFPEKPEKSREADEDWRKAGRNTRRETGGKQGGKRGKRGKQGKVTSSWEAKGEPEKNKNQRTREPGKREENREETRGKQGGN